MAAPKGNNFWEARSSHGRDKIFEDPETLWSATLEYFQWCIDNPLMEVDFRGKDAKKVELPKMRSFSLEGLCLFLQVNTRYFKDFKLRIAAGTCVRGEDFAPIIARIEDTIFSQQYDGAAAGFLNPNIVARKLGLSEKIESKIEAKLEAVDYTKLDEETMSKLLDASADRLIEG